MSNITKFLLFTGFVCAGFLCTQAYNPVTVEAAKACSGGSCFFTNCNTNADCGTNRFIGSKTCQGNAIYGQYATHTCNNPGTTTASCTTSYNYNFQTSCSASQTCQNGSCRGSITTQTSGGSSAVNPASYRCVGNSVYFFDNNGNQQGIYQACNSGQSCQSGVCVNTATTNQQTTYNYHFMKGCVNDLVYWYDSNGAQRDVYQNCSLTGQTCQSAGCSGPVNTSSSTTSNSTTNNSTTNNTTNNTTATPTTKIVYVAAAPVKTVDLATSILGQKQGESLQFGKMITAVNNDKINFLITVKNTTGSAINNVIVKIESVGNITIDGGSKVDNFLTKGDIMAGLDIGSIPSNTTKSVTFVGVISYTGNDQSLLKVTAITVSGKKTDNDSLVIALQPAGTLVSATTKTEETPKTTTETKTNSTTAAISQTGLFGFLKGWYLWIIVAVLGGLFFIIFRKLSAN